MDRANQRSIVRLEKPDDLVILREIVTHHSRPQTSSRPLLLVPLFSRSSFPSCYRRRNCRRNISASNVARLIRKVRCNIRNYGTHFSRTGRNNEEKTAQLVTTYCAINGTARLWPLCVYVFAVVHHPRNFRFIWKSRILHARQYRAPPIELKQF